MARLWQRIGIGALALVGLGAALAATGVSRAAVAEPPFALVREEGAIQVRDYPALTVARTEAPGERNEAVRTGFRRLFDYIQGANRGAASIAMTAPVLVAPAGEAIAMTAPVLSEAAAGGWATVFVLPEGMTAATAPVPTDPAVRIATIPARRVAVIRFSGRLGGGRAEAPRRELEAWLAANGLAHAGDWQSAGYDPPWTLPPFRRNEVLVTLVP